jgi:membrane associated rhomboid family serine protease
MFLPLSDDNPLEGVRHAYVNWAIIAANVLIFVAVQHGYQAQVDTASAFEYGAIPAVVSRTAVLPPELVRLPAELTLLTYMFLHGGWMHLIGNMAFLAVFGDNVEDALGHVRYAIFYLACGIAGGVTHILMQPYSEVPLVGASAAVAGVVAAYLLLHPNVRLWALIFMRIPLRIPAVWPISAWIVFQVWSIATATDDGTAFWAHIGGLIAGAILIVFLRRKGVPLLVRSRDGTPPPATESPH